MPKVNFLQIHSLHGYSAALLNRDDSGLAKRINYGGTMRTRVSSQCLKRHWRVATDPHALEGIDTDKASIRSRETVTRRVIGPLGAAGCPEGVASAIEVEFQKAVYGDKGDQKSNRQPLLLGEPEIRYLASEARKIADANSSDAASAGKAAKQWAKEAKANMKKLRDGCKLPGGLAAALFGRMVTSDVEANIDAAIHVAHAFTVHAEESESDYFTVVDDLHRVEDDAGADHIGETELTSGLFYGYVVVDRNMLLSNLGGDRELAGEVARNLVHLIATVSPGAKLGSTAPYGYASSLLLEAGDRQPRSLAEAFRDRCAPVSKAAEEAMIGHMENLDRVYGQNESRRSMAVSGVPFPGAGEPSGLNDLADWAGGVVRQGEA